MSEITPDYSLTPNQKTAAGVDLAPVIISPSLRFWYIELAFYLCLFCSASIALVPLFLTVWYWLVLWLIFSLLIIFILRRSFRAQKLPSVKLSVQQKSWRLKTSEGELVVVPFEDILLWAGVIILPLRETLSGRKHRLVVLSDSMSADDWRRLRVWLRMGLKDNL